MIVKPRGTPSLMLYTEALYRRLPDQHMSKRIVKQHAVNLRTSYNGEKSLDFPLSFLPNTYRILHNLRIPDKNGFFQLDTFIISRHFAIIIEVKNVYGTIIYDDMGQTIRIGDEIEEGFSNPVNQVNLQCFRLRKWLSRNKLPSFPLKKLVVYSNPKTIIKKMNNDEITTNTVIQKASLLSMIENYSQLHNTVCLTDNDINKITEKLILSHTPTDHDVMKKYEVAPRELLKGVICPKCSMIPMLRIYGKWKCEHCAYIYQ